MNLFELLIAMSGWLVALYFWQKSQDTSNRYKNAKWQVSFWRDKWEHELNKPVEHDGDAPSP